MTLVLRWGRVVSIMPQPLYPQERPGTHCTVGWVGPRAGLDGCRKSHPPLGFDPQTAQPVASCYTDYAIPACDSQGCSGAIQVFWNVTLCCWAHSCQHYEELQLLQLQHAAIKDQGHRGPTKSSEELLTQ